MPRGCLLLAGPQELRVAQQATLEFAFDWVGAGDISCAIRFVALQLGAATAGAGTSWALLCS